MKIKTFYIYFLLLVSLFLSSCTKINEEKFISTSIYPVYALTKAIVEDKMDVYLTVGEGIDTHSYDPSVDNIIRIKKSSLFIYVSDELETWATNLKNEDEEHLVLNLTKKTSIELLEIEDEHEEKHHHHHEYDPHIWTSPKNAVVMAEDIYQAVIKIDPENEAFYKQNKERYINELNNVINKYEEKKEQLQTTTYYFATPFPFLYLFEDFGLNYYSIYDTCETEIEPSIEEILKIKELIINENISYIYVKELTSTKVAEAIVSGTNCQILELHSAHNVAKGDLKYDLIHWYEQNLINLLKGAET